MIDRVTQLAFQIADSAASCDIEIHCAPVGGEPSGIEEMRVCWFDLNQVIDPTDVQIVKTSVEYLDYRGLLNRHPTHVNWARPRHAIAEVKASEQITGGSQAMAGGPEN